MYNSNVHLYSQNVYYYFFMYYSRLIEPKIRENLDSDEAVILTGMRRTGKTSLAKKIFDDLPKNKIWFDFENPLDVRYFEDIDYNDVYVNIANKGDLDKSKRIYVFIDEVQHYPEISKIVKYLIDHYKVKFFLTGSASYYLKNLFPESLAGRKIIFELYPLDFEEFLIFKKENIEKYREIKNKKIINRLDYEIYDKYYEEFLEWGGFPAVVLAEGRGKKEQMLKDIFSSYYQNEIVSLADYRKNEKIRDLILLLASRAGSQLDLVKLSQELGIARVTVYSYLAFLQATYFIHLISPFSKSIDREVSGAQKVYFCDNGILKIIAKLNIGQIFENSIYNQLKIKGDLNYFRKPSGAEIDFILDKKTAFEVKATATMSYMNDFKKSMETAKLKEGCIISKNFVEGLGNVVFGEFV